MPIQNLQIQSIDDLINKVFQDDTDKITFIMPSLESKKDMVERLARRWGSIPDQSILRLNEFFARQVQNVAPEMQFLDKDLLNLILKTSLKQNPELKKYTPFVDVALDYISIFSPILGRDIYRQALEALIDSDPLFLKNYGDLYPFLVKVWDQLLDTKQILPSWSLGWLFKNLPILESQSQTLYIFGPHKLKNIEKDFFDELARTWTIYFVDSADINETSELTASKNPNSLKSKDPNYFTSEDSNSFTSENPNRFKSEDQNSFTSEDSNSLKVDGSDTQKGVDDLGGASVYKICELVSPLDEIDFCLSIFENLGEGESVNVIAPKAKWYYKEMIEAFLKEDTLVPTQEVHLSHREMLNKFLSPLKVQTGEYEAADLKTLWEQTRKDFKNQQEFTKYTEGIFDNEAILGVLKQLKAMKLPQDSLSFLDFLDLVISSHPQNADLSLVLRKLYSVALQTPTYLKLPFEDWVKFIEIKLSKISPNLRSQKINFYTLDEARWVSGETNIFLSCTRQDYERNIFAYLSDYEVERVKFDLGFDLEGLSPKETFKLELKEHSQKSIINYFLVPEFDFIGTSQQRPQFLQILESQSPAQTERIKFNKKSIEKILKAQDPNLCTVSNFTLNKLSASALQTYIDRPYEFFLSYVLGLREETPLDIDPSALLSGSIFHELLQVFLEKDNVQANDLKAAAKQMVESAYKFWPSTKAAELQVSKYTEDIIKYLKSDQQRKATSGRKTLATELSFTGHFDLQDLKFHKDPKPGRVLFNGVIDRIDVVESYAFLIDYKSGQGTINHVKNLFSNPNVQMPIYAMAFEDGLLDLDYELAGLLYISIKNQFQETAALVVKDHTDLFFEKKMTARNTGVVDQKKFQETIDDYRLFIKQKIVEIQQNKFGSWIKEDGKIIPISVDF